MLQTLQPCHNHEHPHSSPRQQATTAPPHPNSSCDQHFPCLVRLFNGDVPSASPDPSRTASLSSQKICEEAQVPTKAMRASIQHFLVTPTPAVPKSNLPPFIS
jgi:hypothetical protein